jgi:predicted nucleotidyltransferase
MSRKPAVIKIVNQGYKALKIIHGYGSSGVGGALRAGLQATLRRAVHDGDISAVIYGENWRVSDEATWELLKRYPEWKADSDLGRGNKGISIVVL